MKITVRVASLELTFDDCDDTATDALRAISAALTAHIERMKDADPGTPESPAADEE